MKKNKLYNNILNFTYKHTIISISLLFFLIGLLGILFMNIYYISSYEKEKLPIEIFLKENASNKKIKIFFNLIKSYKYIKTLKYIDKNQAKKIAKKELNILNEDLPKTITFPSSIKLKIFSNYFEPKILKIIISKLKKNIIVDEIKYPKYFLEKINNNIKKWTFCIISLIFILFIIFILLINSITQLNFYSKRFTIKTMKIIGSKRKNIYIYFFKKNILLNFVAISIATPFLLIINYYLYNYIKIPYEQNSYMLYILFISLITITILTSLISTYFLIRKFLNLKEDYYYV